MLRNGYKLSDCGISSGTTLRLVVKGDGMLIYIKVLSVTCELVPLAVEPTDTIESVKWKYHAQEGILPDKQLLFFGSKELENERTLFYHGISDEARLELLLPMPSIPRTGQIQVLIRLLSNPPVFTLGVELTDTVINLKDKIHDIRGIPPAQQRLIVRGVQMEDVRMLWTYGLEKDFTIHLVLQLRGDQKHRWVGAFVSEPFRAP